MNKLKEKYKILKYKITLVNRLKEAELLIADKDNIIDKLNNRISELEFKVDNNQLIGRLETYEYSLAHHFEQRRYFRKKIEQLENEVNSLKTENFNLKNKNIAN